MSVEIRHKGLVPLVDVPMDFGPKPTSLEKQPEEVAKLMKKLGPDYVFLGGWLNDCDFDSLVDPEIDGRTDILVWNNSKKKNKESWVLFDPEKGWSLVSKDKLGVLIEEPKSDLDDLVSAIKPEVSEKVAQKEILPCPKVEGKPIDAAQAELASKLGVDGITNLDITRCIYSTSRVYGEDILMRWGERPQTFWGVYTVVQDSPYKQTKQDVYEVKYSSKDGWQIPKDYIKEPGSHRRIGIYYGSATIDEVAAYLKPRFKKPGLNLDELKKELTKIWLNQVFFQDFRL